MDNKKIDQQILSRLKNTEEKQASIQPMYWKMNGCHKKHISSYLQCTMDMLWYVICSVSEKGILGCLKFVNHRNSNMGKAVHEIIIFMDALMSMGDG